jgi:uncharacterized protein
MQSKTNSQENGNTLFVKKFKTKKFHYVYDINSNEIIKVNRLIWDMIDHFHKPFEQISDILIKKYEKKDILSSYESIRKAQSAGMFSCRRPIIHSVRKDRDEILYVFKNGGLQQLILDLTNQCNMRCKYCIYSGKYRYERSHRDSNMPLETAIKAVDYFMNCSSKSEKPDVTFYGGEPFLEFELFRYIIDYVKSKSNNYNFSLTTNGTLLNAEVASYLIKNDISINVSLDGPKHVHDKNRVLLNGSGSYELVMNNLKYIKETDQEYFLNKISYSLVTTPPYDFEAIKSFFYSSDFFHPSKSSLRIVPASTYATTFFEKKSTLIARQQYKKNRDKMLRNFKNAIMSGKYSELTIEKKIFAERFSSIHFREKAPLAESLSVLGQCTPGIRRLFVNPEGKYYMCEKVGEYFCLGDIDTGLDFDRIYNFYEQCDEFFQVCSNCWLVRLCKKCFAAMNRKDHFDIERRERFCKSNLAQYEQLLRVYCEIQEDKPDALNVFNPVEYYKKKKKGSA